MQEEIVKEESSRAGVLLLDWSSLQETCLYKKSLVEKLLGLYLQQLPEWLNDIRTSVDQKDAEKVRRICHTVRGATAAIHASGCVLVLEKLNALARKGSVAEFPEIFPEVILVLEQTAVLIRRLLSECPST